MAPHSGEGFSCVVNGYGSIHPTANTPEPNVDQNIVFFEHEHEHEEKSRTGASTEENFKQRNDGKMAGCGDANKENAVLRTVQKWPILAIENQGVATTLGMGASNDSGMSNAMKRLSLAASKSLSKLTIRVRDVGSELGCHASPSGFSGAFWPLKP